MKLADDPSLMQNTRLFLPPVLTDMLIEYLKNIPLFKHLKDTQLKEMAERCKSVTYKKGAVIFHKTDLSTDLYIVNSGRVKAVGG